MKFDKTVSKISGTVAGVIMFMFVFGMYLSSKGFVLTPEGKVVYPAAVNKAQKLEPVGIDVNKLPKAYVLGNENAGLKIYEFSSFNCYYCVKFHNEKFAEIKKEYIDTGKASFVFVDFPLDRASMQGALVASCIDKDKYFDFVNKVFETSSVWSKKKNPSLEFVKYAKEFGLSEEKAKQCLADENKAKQIMELRKTAMQDLKIEGTPTFVVVKENKPYLFGGSLSAKNLSQILNKN